MVSFTPSIGSQTNYTDILKIYLAIRTLLASKPITSNAPPPGALNGCTEKFDNI